jgi:DnaJ domain
MSHRDINGYYAALKIPVTGSASQIKSAYRALAKEFHPDSGRATDGGTKFKAISHAYSVLGDPEQRAEYDSMCVTVQPSASRRAEAISPITCGKCGKVTAQPRYLVFRSVVSVILTTIRTPTQGIYCATCAKSAALKATLISSLFGWWGVPWGPIFTIGESFRNAFGGENLVSNEEKLLWHNVLAFASRGDGKIALGLIERLKNASDEKIVADSRTLADIIQSQGFAADAAKLINPWAFNPIQSLLHVAAVAALPAIASYMIYQSDVTSSSDQTYSSYIASGPYAPPPKAVLDSPKSGTGTAIDVADNVPSCKSKPANGKILSGRKRLVSKGHMLQIQNGSGGDSIIKIRTAATGILLASFFAANNETASLEGIPDGTYIIQYAFGEKLGEDCKSFTRVSSAGQFPDSETLTTERVEDYLGTQIKRSRISYTLYSVPGGNVRPDSLDAAAFNSE